MATETYQGDSLVDFLKSTGQDSSLSSRANLAVSNKLVGSTKEYYNLAGQGKNADVNTKLLGALRAGGSGSSEQPTTTAGNASQFNRNTVTATDMEKGMGLPDPTTVAETEETVTLSDRVSQIAGTTLDSTRLAIDNLRAEQQKLIEADKAKAQAKRDKAEAGIQDFVGTTEAQDTLAEINKRFKVEDNIKLYSDIQQKIVDAQQALEVGLIYEKDRPARMRFVTGAQSTLMKQGLATIGALQGTAAVIKGNVDMAAAYADSTIQAINDDNAQSFAALTTLLDLANNDLVNLESDERDIINDRLDSIEKETTRIQENKDAVLELMTLYPRAFQAGGVTLLDSKETALQKMLPTMAADEAAKLAAATAKSSTVSDKDGPAADKAQLLQLKANGMTLEEAIDAFGDTVSISWIRSAYNQPDPKNIGGEDAITNAYYNQFLNPDGTLKTGFSVGINDKGTPIVEEEEAAEGESTWWKPWTWGN